MRPDQLLEIDSSVTNKKFYFAGRRLLLTYKTHIDKVDLIDAISDANGAVPEFIRACHEIGNSKDVPYEHTHVLIDFGSRKQTKDCRKFDMELEGGVTVHPNWKPVTTGTHFKNCAKYIAKEDPDNADLLEADDVNIVNRVWSCPTLEAALESCCKSVADVTGVIALYKARPREHVEITVPNFPWHSEVIDFLETERPGHRAVHWFYDPVGNTGKSWLSKWLHVNKLAYVIKGSPGTTADFAEIIRSALDEDWDQKAFVVDIPRVCEDYNFYDKLEILCDGMVTCRKWAGKTLSFRTPHIMVMANFLPNRTKMSADRWRIHHILPERALDKPMSFTSRNPHLTLEIPLAAKLSAGGEKKDNVLTENDLEEVLSEIYG